MSKIGIIIRREFNERVRKKSFIITTIITPLLFVGLMFAPLGLMKFSGTTVKHILVHDASGRIADQLESDDVMVFETTSKTLDDVKADREAGRGRDIFGLLVIGPDILTNPSDVNLYAFGPTTVDLERGLAYRMESIIEGEKLKGYDIEDLPRILDEIRTEVRISAYTVDSAGEEKESSSGLSMVLALISGFLIYMFVFLYGAMVMQGVIEEKSSKVLEIMVSSVKPFQLMMGKILGIASVALTQFAIWAVVIVVAAMGVASFLTPDMAAGMLAEGDLESMTAMQGFDAQTIAAVNSVIDPAFLIKFLGGFLLYFIGGYLLYAAMYAAVGSAVENAADSQQLQMPITIPMILAIVLMTSVMRNPDSALAVWFSIIPFTSPVIMVARIPYGVPVWEIVTSLVLLFGTFLAMVWLAGKIYRVGIFMYGKKPTFTELFKWIRYKY